MTSPIPSRESLPPACLPRAGGFSRFTRRMLIGGGLAIWAVPALAQHVFYRPAPLPGQPVDPGGDDSGRVVPAPARGYWPFSGISGPGRPATDASIGQGWVSGLPDVRYRGEAARPYPVAPWADAASGLAVRQGVMPALRPIHHVHIRDTIVRPGPDGWYYMTGSTGDNIWAMNDGVELWRSRDLADWEYRGLVWSIERDGRWERHWRMRKGVPFRALWAPEIHYIRGQWLICHSMSRAGLAILRSTSGRAEGPYVHAFSPDAPIRGGIDATLFEDDDGSVWLTAGSADEIVRLKDDLSGLDGAWQPMTGEGWDLDPRHHRAECAKKGLRHFGYEGATLFKREGRYHLGVVDRYDDRYSFAMWTADRITGPYRDRHELPDCGGGNVFRDHQGRWWVTCFGNAQASPFREMPGLARIAFDADGRIRFTREQPFATRPFDAGVTA